MSKKILIIAGEASSDSHAASLVKAINSISPDIKFFGIGGKSMQSAGVELLYNIVNLAVMGPVDLIEHYSKLRKIYYHLCSLAKQNKPDCAILIDYPGFNLKIAKYLKALGIPIIYYVSPQIWAWGAGRIKKIRRLVDKILVLFSFEEELYKKEGVKVSFVGHPLLDSVKQTIQRDKFLTQLNINPKKTTVGILPGSRNHEVTRILPIMLDAAKLMQDSLGADNVEFLLPIANTIKKDFVKSFLKQRKINITLIEGNTYNALSASYVAMVASGTATLETALLGIPMAIVYRVAMLTYLLLRAVIRIPYIGMVNVMSGKKIVPEFVQYNAKGRLIAEYLLELIRNKDRWQEVKNSILEIKPKLGSPGASTRAAEEVVNFLKKAKVCGNPSRI